jgi:hypothetical protein
MARHSRNWAWRIANKSSSRALNLGCGMARRSRIRAWRMGGRWPLTSGIGHGVWDVDG